MTSTVSTIGAIVDPSCISRKISKEGCAIRLKDAPKDHIVLDMDCDEMTLSANDECCDYLYFSSGAQNMMYVAPIELKSGSPKAAKVARQLQSGADFAESLVPQGAKVLFRPIAAYGKSLRRYQRDKFKQARIVFRRKSELISLVRCGSSMVSALKLTERR